MKTVLAKHRGTTIPIKVCDCHYDLVKDAHWYVPLQKGKKWRQVIGYYPGHTDEIREISRVIRKPKKDMALMFLDGDPFNCQCRNLRYVPKGVVALRWVRDPARQASKYRGVHLRPAYYKGEKLPQRPGTKRWRATLTFEKKRIYLGDYVTEVEAARAYNREAARLYGQYAMLNTIENAEEEEQKKVSQ